MQGFSRPLVLSGTNSDGEPIHISQRQLCELAGDTISVPVMGAIMTTIFACCLFQSPPEPVTVGDAEVRLQAAGVWVGTPTRRRGFGIAVDLLTWPAATAAT